VTGFDTGPANRLLDAWISLNEGKEFDVRGAWASSGRCDDKLLRRLLDEAYFALSAPKSTGRELFNLPWLSDKLGSSSRRPPSPGLRGALLPGQTSSAGSVTGAKGARILGGVYRYA
jgi:anhydro-N-acetylmuramic acid kinase